MFFFFKQKTAYEMRISDWSSDVCSSDLMGSSGNGSIDHLVAMDIAAKLGLKFQHVPYKGNGPALTDLAGGNTNFMYSGSFNSAMPFIKSGQVKPLAVTPRNPSEALPDGPSLSASAPGLKADQPGTRQVLVAPQGPPPTTTATA